MADKKLVKGLKNFFRILESNREIIQKVIFSPEMATKLQYYPSRVPLEKRIEKIRVDHEDPLGDIHTTVDDVENFYLLGIPVEINFAMAEGALVVLNNNSTLIIKGV